MEPGRCLWLSASSGNDECGGVSRRNGQRKTHRLSPYISRQVGVRRTCTCAEEGGKWRLNGADAEWHCWGWMEERWKLVGKK